MYFYVTNLNNQTISREAAEHLLAMRVKPGEVVFLTDLQGHVKQAEILNIDKKIKAITYQTISYQIQPKPPEKVLIQSIPDKRYLDKLAEILPFSSFTRLILVSTHNSSQYSVNLTRLRKISIRSCELAERSWAIEINQADSLSTALANLDTSKLVVLHPSGQGAKTSDWTGCLVGPEGGWTKEELNLFQNLGLQQYSLGKTIYPAWLAGYTFAITAS